MDSKGIGIGDMGGTDSGASSMKVGAGSPDIDTGSTVSDGAGISATVLDILRSNNIAGNASTGESSDDGASNTDSGKEGSGTTFPDVNGGVGIGAKSVNIGANGIEDEDAAFRAEACQVLHDMIRRTDAWQAQLDKKRAQIDATIAALLKACPKS